MLALLVFSWPAARVPSLTLGEAFVHLFAAWIVLVLVLWRISAALGNGSEPRDRGRDG